MDRVPHLEGNLESTLQILDTIGVVQTNLRWSFANLFECVNEWLARTPRDFTRKKQALIVTPHAESYRRAGNISYTITLIHEFGDTGHGESCLRQMRRQARTTLKLKRLKRARKRLLVVSQKFQSLKGAFSRQAIPAHIAPG